MRKTLAGLALVALPLLASGCSEWAVGSAAANVTAAAIQQQQVNAQLAEAAAVDKREANKQLFTYSPEVEAQLKELRATMKEQQKAAAATWKAAGIKTRTTPTTRPAAVPVSGQFVR
jgi:hypothetical protein